MSDQLSKRYLHTGAAPVSPCASIQAQAAPREYPAIESATTPAEVDEGLDSECQMHREMHFRIDNIVMGTGAFEVTHDGDQREAWENTVAAIATLARQLAEAKAEIERRTSDMIVVGGTALACSQAVKEMFDLHKSQLAEATRRLGEVEGLPAAWVKGMGAEHRRICANQLRAALTKEPTK